MKKTGLIFGVLLVVMIGVFFWSLSGASDKHAPAEQRTIDVSPNL
jgi:asparagine N-glycosylation enzyme membrane subunit Stt3